MAKVKTTKKAEKKKELSQKQKVAVENPKIPFFPRIYRFITERNLWVAIASIGLLAFLVFVSQDLQKTIQYERDLLGKRTFVRSEIQSWQAIVRKYPDYRDGYFTLATLEYQIGDTAAAKFYNQKALALDSNFKQGLVLDKLLQIRRRERW
jgi:tetratricopeptide (TPR) repeat protein